MRGGETSIRSLVTSRADPKTRVSDPQSPVIPDLCCPPTTCFESISGCTGHGWAQKMTPIQTTEIHVLDRLHVRGGPSVQIPRAVCPCWLFCPAREGDRHFFFGLCDAGGSGRV
jgi:hypothetical protein